MLSELNYEIFKFSKVIFHNFKLFLCLLANFKEKFKFYLFMLMKNKIYISSANEINNNLTSSFYFINQLFLVLIIFNLKSFFRNFHIDGFLLLFIYSTFYFIKFL